MGKAGIAVASLVIGLLAGGIGGALFGSGAGAGAGAATGMATGICSTMKAAQDLKLLAPEQVDQVLDKAAKDISGKDDLADGEKAVGSAKACDDFMAKFGKHTPQ